jgi:signal transduction histidine kinase
MSLRRKIILLFGVFAIVPLLSLAAFSYWNAGNLIRGMVQEQLAGTARTVAEDVAQTVSGIRTGLDTLAVVLGSLSGGFDPGEPPIGQEITPPLSGATYLSVREASGRVRVLFGSVPEESIRCEDGMISHLVTFSTSIPNLPSHSVLEAGYWASDLLGRQGSAQPHSLTLIRASDGALVAGASECNGQVSGAWLLENSALIDSLRMATGLETSRFSLPHAALEGAMARVDEAGWNVVATTSLAGVLGSLRRLAGLYWVLVLGLGLSTSLAFSILIGRFTRSLSGLTQAAEEIGLGELDPWLPVPTSGELGQLTLAFSRMLERIRQMMNQVSQSGRLAVVGQLSAYLAHEIRNPLSSIKLNLQRLLRWTTMGRLPEYCREPLEISLKEVERLNASVTGVLQLSRAHDAPREVLELHSLLAEAGELVGSRFKKQGVDLVLELDAEADLIVGRPGQLKSVALNLMVNALDAQPTGGHLWIRTALCRSPDHEGPALSLHFRDGGPGVPPEIKDRIFEPFFTTKPGGAGIGLAMAKQSVEDSGGHLYLASSYSRDSGAEFVVVFPLAAADSRERLPGLHGPYRGRPEGLPEEMGAPGDLEGTQAPGAPPHYLLSPRGLKAVLALPVPESEEVN